RFSWRVDGRRLVRAVFEGLEPERPALHVESDDKGFEASVSDALGAGVRVGGWRSFFEVGGPFRRLEGEGLGAWLDRVRADAYDWPDPGEAAEAAVRGFLERVKGLAEGRFLILKVLGPTETAEGFFAPPSGGRGWELGQVLHRYGFGSLYVLRRGEALRIYERIAGVILEVVKAGAELDAVDAVRVADDAATYSGPSYSWSFYEEAYLPWHERIASAVRRAGKYAILHCDGDLRKGGLLERLARLYDGLHPLDLSPKSTPAEALKWVGEVVEARRIAGDAVFFTGAPVDLVFNDSVGVEDFLRVPLRLLEVHGPRRLVVATTHSEYPGRSYREELPRRKVLALREALLRRRV
ncbi:MAG: hypothetical protein QXX25_07635, partial [Thermofilaceae archaeon]